ncbi:MAG: cysteine desulfurase family protein [bacterium]|nr:cysteine desulfurase family protein [bacterium]
MQKIHYFDYASTTPVDKRVLKAMMPFFMDEFGNPSNLYSIGHHAQKALALATGKVIKPLGCKPDEFIFTGSATEADNLALIGVAKANRHLGNKIIVSNVEHKGILAAAEALTKEGTDAEKFELQVVEIGKNGLVSPQKIAEMIDDKTVLVSITYVDSETGTIQPIKEIAKVIANYREINNTKLPYFHTDASQAANFLDINVDNLGVDLLTLSSQKIYGPKGVGGLYIRKGTPIKPIIYGGGQQNNIRSGTENMPGIVGFGAAMEIAEKEKVKESARLKKMRDKLESKIIKTIDKVLVNGNIDSRLPNYSNISILDIEGEAMLLYLDNKGIIINTGSACNSQSLEPSYVLVAFGRPYEYIHGSLRFTLGRFTSSQDVNYVIKNLPPIVKKLRKVSPLDLKIGDEKNMSMPKAFVGGQTPHFLRKQIK